MKNIDYYKLYVETKEEAVQTQIWAAERFTRAMQAFAITIHESIERMEKDRHHAVMLRFDYERKKGKRRK